MDSLINIATIQFVRWVYFHNREDELLKLDSTEDLEKFLIKHTCTFEDPTENFKKGMKFIHFGEILKWIRDKRKTLGAVVEKQQTIPATA